MKVCFHHIHKLVMGSNGSVRTVFHIIRTNVLTVAKHDLCPHKHVFFSRPCSMSVFKYLVDPLNGL